MSHKNPAKISQSIAEKVHQLEYKYYPKIIESVLLDK